MSQIDPTQILDDLPKRRLAALASELGLGAPSRATKADLVRTLLAADTARLTKVVWGEPVQDDVQHFLCNADAARPIGDLEPRPRGGPEPGNPVVLERISELSESLRARTTDGHRKKWGQFLTPSEVALFMAGLVDPPAECCVRVLDPGAGTGILGVAMAQRILDHGAQAVHLFAVEQEPKARAVLNDALEAARAELGDGFTFEVSGDDVLGLAEPELGRRSLEPFDIVIANPPYYKMPPSELRGGSSPNIYTRFMEVGSRLLRAGGQMCFIIPRSFASGLYFRPFRRDFHTRMTLERVHVFDSRRETFKGDGVLQENIVVRYSKSAPNGGEVVISSSAGSSDTDGAPEVRVPLGKVIDVRDRTAVLSLPVSDEDLQLMDLLAGWGNRLADIGLEISTGPVVPFRAESVLKSSSDGGANVPLLWMQHVRREGVVFPLPGGFRKPEYISGDAPEKLLVPNQTYVLLRRFSAKEEARRLTAAVYLAGQVPGANLGLENHLNFIHRPGGEVSVEEARGLAALLNSRLLDRYFRISNGNTQVNATEIRAMPLPALEAIRRIGARVGEDQAEAAVSNAMQEVLGVEG